MTRAVRIALMLGALGLVLWLAVARPLGEGARAASAQATRLRAEEQDLRRQLVTAERRAEMRGRAMAMLAMPQSASDPVTATRRALLEGLRESGVAGVRLSVVPRGTSGATVHVHARGSLAETFAALARVAGAGSGVVLEQVTLRAPQETLSLDVSGATLPPPAAETVLRTRARAAATPTWPAPMAPSRSPFEYADRPAPVAIASPPVLPVAPPPASAPPGPDPAAPRALGVIRRGDRLQVVLSVRGQSVLAAAGDVVSGFKVLEVGTDRVRVQDGGGTIVELEVGS